MKNKWVSVWSNAMSVVDHKPESYAKEITLRMPVLIPFDGDQIRLVLDNFTGTEEVSFEKVSVALTLDDQNIKEETVRTVTFHNNRKLVLKPSKSQVSDPVDLKVRKGERISISIYLKDFTQMRSGVMTFGPLSKAFFSLGDQSETGILPMKTTMPSAHFYFLSRVDVLTEESNHAVICYGDSITAQAWPEYLKLNYMNKDDKRTAVRRGISGSRILRQYDCLHYESFGYRGIERFEHEIDVCGADKIIILHGVNDIIQPVGTEENPFRPWDEMPTLEELKKGMEFYMEKAKRAGLQIYLGTILPIEGWHSYKPFRNELRKELNEWIRDQKGITVIDFDKGMQDPQHSDRLYPDYDSGDHLHPSDAGHRKMAEIAYEVLKK